MLQTEKQEVENANTTLRGRLGTAEASLTEARREIRRYEGGLGTVDRLQDQIANLRAEISELEKKRKPLVLGTYHTTFACTGSMEPKITCLDSATMLENFRPEDIIVGSAISFIPVASCQIKSDSLMHRVKKVKVAGGTHYYWPKGDANRMDDGCWIPEQNVEGYLIELHKNTEPENADLRKLVNSASAQADRAWDKYALRYESYCGFAPSSPRTCYLPQHQIDEIDRLGAIYDAAADHHRCWVNSAAAATRFLGGMPFHRFCIPPPLGLGG